jgi:hypothetical protein
MLFDGPSQYSSKCKCKCSRIICGVYIINWKVSLNFIIALIGGVIIRVSASNARANRHQDISALRQIGTWTNRHRTLGKSTPSLTNRHSFTGILWRAVKQHQLTGKTIVAWLPHKAVKSCPYIQFKTIYSTTLPYSSIKQWQTWIQQRRQEQRLVNLYKCVNNINALQIPPYVVRPTRTTRGQNSSSFIPISCNRGSS